MQWNVAMDEEASWATCGAAYVMPVQANLEDGIQEWAEKERGLAVSRRSARRSTSVGRPPYDPAGAQRRIVSGAPTAISNGTRRKWVPNEEELPKLSSESGREAIRSMLENRSDSERTK